MCVLSPSAHSVPRHGSRHCRQEGEGNQHWDPSGLGGDWAGGPEAKLWGGKEERLPLGILSPTSSLQHSKKMPSERLSMTQSWTPGAMNPQRQPLAKALAGLSPTLTQKPNLLLLEGDLPGLCQTQH